MSIRTRRKLSYEENQQPAAALCKVHHDHMSHSLAWKNEKAREFISEQRIQQHQKICRPCQDDMCRVITNPAFKPRREKKVHECCIQDCKQSKRKQQACSEGCTCTHCFNLPHSCDHADIVTMTDEIEIEDNMKDSFGPLYDYDTVVKQSQRATAMNLTNNSLPLPPSLSPSLSLSLPLSLPLYLSQSLPCTHLITLFTNTIRNFLRQAMGYDTLHSD